MPPTTHVNTRAEALEQAAQIARAQKGVHFIYGGAPERWVVAK